MNTKIFCDIAELDQIKKFNKKKIVKGFTTNPSLMRKAGAKDYKSYSKKILKICNNKPVSVEVFADGGQFRADDKTVMRGQVIGFVGQFIFLGEVKGLVGFQFVKPGQLSIWQLRGFQVFEGRFYRFQVLSCTCFSV